MAIGWMTALKVIPWGDVIEATPGIVKGARKMFARTQQAEEPLVEGDTAQRGDLSARVALLEDSLTHMVQQQKASAQLIETLAEQNARIVEAVEILRVRTRMLLIASFVLTALLAASVFWAVGR
ncbi:MAG: hypothetical protein ABW190_02485 [Rhizobacter sp.]